MWRKNIKLTSTPMLIICRHKTSNADYNYLQNSKIPTMHFQKSLPRLPVPKLETTCSRYLAAQKPLLIDEAYRKTEENVIHFRETVGKSLQEQLVKKDKENKHTSYITDLWFDKYLRDRTALPINSNPVLVFQNDTRPEYNKQSIRAANFLVSALRFYKSLQKSILEPEVFHMNPKKSDNNSFRTICSMVPANVSWYAAYMHNAYPLDMSQYYNLFNSTRIPEIDIDRIYSKPAKHILIQYKGHFYVFDVLDDNSNILNPEQLLSGIENVLIDKVADSEFPLGVLTTMDRNKWASVRHHLCDLNNEAAFKLIDTALFNICLDDDVIGEDKYRLVRTFLHGSGKNRWFDKSISLQISKDGFSAINFEHSWGDGVAVLRFFQDLYKDTIKNPYIHPTTKVTNETQFKKLEFNLDDASKAAINNATNDYKKVCDSLAINYLESDGLGKEFCKKYSVSPDAIMQLCFQNSYYKQYGKFVSTYESCSTAAFKHGRTETIRPNTTATKAFCKAVNAKSRPSNSELTHLIKECSKMHGQLTKEAAMGQGFDRHLFVLQQLANKTDLAHANIYEDPAYAAMNHNILSTSTLSSPAVLAGGFGPVVEDGFGIGYVIRENAMGTLVTSYPKLDGREFINCLKSSIDEVVTILRDNK